ncbi:MAG TPA: formylglycine-generating enzyme family protein [Candidatus Sulfotelmatobacter sp.]|jgi:formylglycine-generating enzyme required for sulfatase activity|nr:formylglycine-generating enzyme family protein [Candidatus Sulfotelmatobacter sp.]
MKLQRIWIVAVLFLACLISKAQDSRFSPNDQQIPVPDCQSVKDLWTAGFIDHCMLSEHESWLADITHWRNERRIRVAYTGSRYDMPALQWTQSSFMQPQMMVQDRYFYDPVAGKYTVDRYVDDLEKRYGGIDSVLIWPTYPNMGIDDRNQHDLIRSMPGGVGGVKGMIADFHRRGVRVLFPMMMWDQGTRQLDHSWPEEIASLMAEIGADGINGDTQDGVPLAFSLAADKTGHPLVFEPEGGPSDEALAWNLITWGQYQFPFTPLIDRYKWLETRHMVNISDRWNRDKTSDLQFAFFNGVGWESWENIWGIWNGITPRDAEATRRVATIERALEPFLVSKDWEPMAPMLHYGVFASRWPLGDQTLWTIVNRNEYNIEGDQFEVPASKGTRYFDVYHGVELKVQMRAPGRTVLSFAIEAKGYGAILATNQPDAGLQSLRSKMQKMTSTPLANYSHEWKVVPQQIVPIKATDPATSTPAGMVKIPAAEFQFEVSGIEIEGSNDMGVDAQYPWEDSPRRFHSHAMHIDSFYIDKYPVTNADFKKFLDTAHYHPKDDLNFLRDWKDGAYPAGWENRPVTWVSQEDARAYANWAGKRLPHEWEWQYAAQGNDARLYPWGNDWDASAVPLADKSRTMRGPDAVDAHPKGASPFGVMDTVGNVWQWTEEFVDDHTRAAILRGGSYYQPQGSIWYFPQAYRLNQHGKQLLMSPSMDRSGGVGFRCVRDAK